MQGTRFPVTAWLVKAYLLSPFKPAAGQMLVIAQQASEREAGACTVTNGSASCCPRTTRNCTSARRSATSSLPGIVDEVIVVDNNSRDRTAEEAAMTPARIVAESAQGYGYALRRGLREATGDLVILAEPDGTFVGRDILKLLAYSDDFDMVCGTRTTRELIWEQANMGWFLRVGNWAVAKLIQILHDGPSLTDCGCTLRLIRRSALAQIADRFTVGGSHFLPEMVILALKSGLRVIEVPVNYRGTSRRVEDHRHFQRNAAHGHPHDRARLEISPQLITRDGLSRCCVILAAVLPYLPDSRRLLRAGRLRGRLAAVVEAGRIFSTVVHQPLDGRHLGRSA